MSEPTPFLQVVPQRHQFDCAVACLAMLVGQDYETVLLAFNSLAPLVMGVRTRDIKRAAKVLGHQLRFTRRVDLEHDTGLLAVRSAKWKTEHLVVLKEGLVVDTDATIWDADVFLAAYEATVLSLLTKED